MTRPGEALVDDLAQLRGRHAGARRRRQDGADAGPHRRAPRRDKRVVGVARFSEPRLREQSRGCGIETHRLRSARPRGGPALPEARQRRLHGGHASSAPRAGRAADLGHEHLVPPMSPRRSAARASSPSPRAASILCRAQPRRNRGRRRRSRRPANTPSPASAASACSSTSRARNRTPGRLIRLNYAIDLRYGVLHDVATRCSRGAADRTRHGPRQRHLAGRRQRDGVARARPLHDADQRRST